MKRKHLGSLALTVALAAAHGLAQAGPISFSESTCTSGNVSANAITCGTKVTGVNYAATFSAWSAPTSANFNSASLVYYPFSGAGIVAKGESQYNSEHAVDNANGTDAFLINFGSLNFALNQISIGWRDGDSDVSILRYTGTEAPSLGNYTVGNLKNAGWELVGDYSTLSPSSPLSFNNTGTVKTASWWLVSAYNSAYSGNPSPRDLGNGNDYFKLSSLGGEVVAVVTPPSSEVPEPGSFALFGIALLGFAAARRKFNAR